MKFLDFQIAVTAIMIFISYKWGDWQHWRLYYPTILYFIAGDLSSTVLTYNYPLWQFESKLLKTTGSDFLITIVFFSAALLVYLSHFPKGNLTKIFYVSLWVLIFTGIEIVSYLLGFFSYHNGWNILWSLAFNCIMFPLLKLHQRNPPVVWLISFITAAAVLIYFKVPFSSMK